MNSKKCTKCGIEKPLTEFHKKSCTKGGHRAQCRECRAKQYAEYRSQNKERIAEKDKAYAAKNKERIAERLKKYRTENKERLAEYAKEYYSDNRERALKYSREYKAKKEAEQPNCVYQIKNLENNKVYIGETMRGELRWKQHLTRLRGNRHRNISLQEDFNKYGEEAFEWTILKEFESDDKDALILEEARTIQRYIQDGVELYNEVFNLKTLEENKDIE